MRVAGHPGPLPGGAPTPDMERVAALRFAIMDDAEGCAAFAETPRAALADLNDRAVAETHGADLAECSTLLTHLKDCISALDPARLEPRTGLAGLFDSRSKRLKAFREAWASAASAAAATTAHLSERGHAIARKGSALDTLWTETRDAIADLDAHLAAGRAWLEDHLSTPAPMAPPEAEAVEDAAETDTAEAPADAQADAEASHSPLAEEPEIEASAGSEPTASEVEAVAEPGAEVDGSVPVFEHMVEDGSSPSMDNQHEAAPPETAARTPSLTDLPHPLDTRLTGLAAMRSVALARLPHLRTAQNADCRAPAALKAVADGVEAWRTECQDALGLAGKRPKKVRPDPARLTAARNALTAYIEAAERELAAARSRRAELETRAPAAEATAIAA